MSSHRVPVRLLFQPTTDPQGSFCASSRPHGPTKLRMIIWNQEGKQMWIHGTRSAQGQIQASSIPVARCARPCSRVSTEVGKSGRKMMARIQQRCVLDPERDRLLSPPPPAFCLEWVQRTFTELRSCSFTLRFLPLWQAIFCRWYG
jgi:hypothetical protein